jgi:hypothetical protein
VASNGFVFRILNTNIGGFCRMARGKKGLNRVKKNREKQAFCTAKINAELCKAIARFHNRHAE